MNKSGVSTINNNITKIVVISTIITILFCSFTSNAGTMDTTTEMFYKSVTVRPGDTIWALSNELSTTIGAPTKDIVALIMKINNLTNDRICTGDNLIIPYIK